MILKQLDLSATWTPSQCPLLLECCFFSSAMAKRFLFSFNFRLKIFLCVFLVV